MIGEFTKEMAEAILNAWKKQFSNYWKNEMRKDKLQTKFLTFSTVSFEDTVKSFENVDVKKAIIAVSILVSATTNEGLVWSSCCHI